MKGKEKACIFKVADGPVGQHVYSFGDFFF